MDPNLIKLLNSTLVSRASGLKIRSAAYPILWLVGAVAPVGLFSAAVASNSNVATFILWIVAVTVGVACVVLLYFAIAKPDKLQSEEFQLKQQVIQILEQKGAAPELLPPLTNLVPKPNTENKLEEDEK